MDRLPCCTLRYSNFENATELLAETFSSWPPRIPFTDPPPADIPMATEPDSVLQQTGAQRLRPETTLIRNAAATLHRVEDDLFLATPDGSSIHRLNAIGAGLWNLLAEPISEQESIDILCGAFPDGDRAAIAADVTALFAALSREGLVVAAE